MVLLLPAQNPQKAGLVRQFVAARSIRDRSTARHPSMEGSLLTGYTMGWRTPIGDLTPGHAHP